jgi:hypothetical protein
LESGHLTACAKPKLLPGWPPAPPFKVEVFEFDAVRIQLGWASSNGAEGYYVHSRYIPDNGGFTRSPKIPTYTTIGIGFLFPGAWNYEFCISAYVGDLESTHDKACIVPPVFNGSKKKREELTARKLTSISSIHHIVLYPNPSSPGSYFNITLPLGNPRMSLSSNATPRLSAGTLLALQKISTLHTFARPSTTALVLPSTTDILAGDIAIPRPLSSISP